MDFISERVSQYLCPPGNGVHTVHTAKENKESLHQKIYGTINQAEIENKWKESLSQLHQNQLPVILGVTLDTGGGIQRGANWGPLFLRNQIQDQFQTGYFDIGDIRTIPHLLHDKYLNDETIEKCRLALYEKNNQLPVSGLSIAEDFCTYFYQNFENQKILGLGGDHSVSYPLVGPWIKARRALGKKVGIIHFDAHTDLMPHRLGVDICFASWAYHMLELLEKPSHLIQLGIRSSGMPKSHWEENLGVQQFWAQECEEHDKVVEKILNYISKEKLDEVYISFDIDALDANYASATGTPEEKGMEPHQCVEIISQIAKVVEVTGADLVEVAPFVASQKKSKLTPEPETTLLSSKTLLDKFIEVMK